MSGEEIGPYETECLHRDHGCQLPDRPSFAGTHHRGTAGADAEWWETRRDRFDLYVSPLVVSEAQEGDPAAAERRMGAIAGIPALAVTEVAPQNSVEFEICRRSSP